MDGLLDDVAPVVNPDSMKKLGQSKSKEFEQYKKDRRDIEFEWLRNIRQVKGIYDPEIKALMQPDQSTAYPKITRQKLIGTVARLMEMLFPQTEKNWGIAASPIPDLSQTDLQAVLDALQQQNPQVPPTDDQIKDAIVKFASSRAENMEKVIEDQLDEIDYVSMARKVIYSGAHYSCGVLQGPMVRTREGRTWSKDPATGMLVAKVEQINVPYYEQVSVWDWYPDLSAKDFEQMDGEFRRHVLSRNKVRELAKRPDFMADVIIKWLQDNIAGNYQELHWEKTLREKSSDRSNVSNMTGRKYELWEWWGSVSGHELSQCGVSVPDDQLAMEVEGTIWGIGDIVIKAKLNPYDAKIRPFHTFVFEDDDVNLTGSGLPIVVRDSQLAVAEASGMLMDNAGLVCGDMLEINTELLMPGQTPDVYARKKWLRDDTGASAAYPAVRPVQMEAHISELINVVNLFTGFADTETALPPPTMGDPTKGGSEAMRTTGGMSMLMGAAALPIRDTVRNFDKFTTSFIGSLYYWNMQFNPDPSIKGDCTIIARGSTSLIAKELRASSLDQFRQTLSPEEQMHVNTRKLLEERMKARDIPLDVLDPEADVQQKLDAQSAQAQQDKQIQNELINAEIKQGIAAAVKDIASANKATAAVTVDTFNAIVDGIENEHAKSGVGNSPANSVPKSAGAGAASAASVSGG